MSILTLPNELWLYIAEFVPPRDRRRLLGINRLLFELIMSEIYREATFTTWNPYVLCDLLRSLQNPGLAKRVRVLSLKPGSIKEAIRAKVDLRDRIAGYLVQGRTYVEGLLNHASFTSSPRLRADLPLLSPKQRIKMFLSIIPNFTNVDTFMVVWLSRGSNHPRYAWTTAFFPEIWRTIGPNLRHLSLDIRSADIGEAVKVLPSLEKLDLTVMFGEREPFVDNNGARVSSFVNSFAATLQSLSMKTYGRHHDFSTLFEHLGTFPRLRKLSLITTLDTLHLSDATGLRWFLRSHPEVEHLCVRYKRCACLVESEHDGFETGDGKHKIYGDVSFPAMHTLELGLTLPPLNTNTKVLYKNLARLGNGLTILILQDRIMEFNEIKTMLEIFPSEHLKKLMLMTRELNPQFIDYLAETCPALQSLSLHAERVTNSDVFYFPLFDDVWTDSDWFGFGHALIECVDRNIERYTTWTLSDISIMRWKQRAFTHVYDWTCMLAIADAVPSVSMFVGRKIPDVKNRLLDGTISENERVETFLDLDALDWYRGPRWLI